ncbi:MAG: biopolymer transporter ExbD [Bacteroidales bacterium]|nr:biopolymer transporter ExbD [Bacteroidales bacterium]
MAKKTPGLNTGSMADISFLLLTFFLLTSSINTDQGIQRRLPPPLQGDKATEVHKRDILTVLVNMHDQIMVNGEILPDVQLLKDKTKEFIANPTNDPSLSDKKLTYIKELDKEEYVSKGVVSLQNDRGTSYEMYIAVQNQLTAAFNELMEEYSQSHFGKSLHQLNEQQLKGVKKVIPVSISEAEPVNYGGK